MTREEVISELNYLKEYYNDKDVDVYQGFDDEDNEALDIAIKALEQEDILDKIRAEIWDLQYGPEEKSETDEDMADAYNNAIRQVIEIIDKYKAESEDEE